MERVPEKTQQEGVLPSELAHQLLVGSDRLQLLPAAAVGAAFLFDTLLVAAVWFSSRDLWAGIAAGSVQLAAGSLNWWLLWRLPRTGRSYGPDKPSALGLAALLACVLILLGLIAAPVWTTLLAAVGLTAVAYYATWIEPFRLGVTRQQYTTAAWQAAAPPLRVLHLGDLHVERITQRERKLNEVIASLKPDIIVFSGDFVNLSYKDDELAEQHIREVISAWHAPLGVYCVPGTPAIDASARVDAFVKDLDNLKLLRNQWFSLTTPNGQFNILGLVTTHDLTLDRAAFKRLLLTAPKQGLSLLLVHSPDLAPEADAAGFDLYICGHTHGGQLRLPLIGALATGSKYRRRFVMGRYDLKNVTLYTTRGLGMEGLGAPRARFLCPPEMVLWEISGQ